MNSSSDFKKNFVKESTISTTSSINSNNVQLPQLQSHTLNNYKNLKNGNNITNSLIHQLNNNVNNTLNIQNVNKEKLIKNKLSLINNNNNTLTTTTDNTTTDNTTTTKSTGKKSISKETKKNVNYLVSGSVAGAISRSVTAGFERLTIIQQVQGMCLGNGGAAAASTVANQGYVGCIPALKEMIKREGIKSIWKGNLANVVKVSPNSGIRFLTYEFCKKKLVKSRDGSNSSNSSGSIEHSVPLTLFSGAMAGLTSTFLTYPLDVVRIRLSLQGSMGGNEYSAHRYNGITHGFIKIHREEGIRGLYKGLGTSIFSIVPWVSLSFATYEGFKIIAKKTIIEHQTNKNNNLSSSISSSVTDNNKQHHTIQSSLQQQQQQPSMSSLLEDDNELKKGVNMVCDFVCGALSGAVTMTVCYPLDVLRRRMMIDGIGGSNKLLYKNGIDAARKILKLEGVSAFYHGIFPAYFKVVPTVAISFAVYSLCKDMVENNNNKQ